MVAKILITRNLKLFFFDKGRLFTALITPGILLLLYTTFLGRVYRESFGGAWPELIPVSDKLINGFVAGQLVSSLLAVSCVTVAFFANVLMVEDKLSGVIDDFLITPVKPGMLNFCYFVATLLAILMINFMAIAVGFTYIGLQGWFLSAGDVAATIGNVILLYLFGTALSSVVFSFLNTHGQISAVGTIVSAGYGFICGAYMPISNFSVGLQRTLSFLPGTYGTSLLRRSLEDGVFREMKAVGFPEAGVEGFKTAVDYYVEFFGKRVDLQGMYLVMFASISLLLVVFLLLSKRKNYGK